MWPTPPIDAPALPPELSHLKNELRSLSIRGQGRVYALAPGLSILYEHALYSLSVSRDPCPLMELELLVS
jgi:hypothetical protein